MKVRPIKRGSPAAFRRRRKVAPSPPVTERAAKLARFERLAVPCPKCGTRVLPGAPMKAHRKGPACRVARDTARIARDGLIPVPYDGEFPGVHYIKLLTQARGLALYVQPWAADAMLLQGVIGRFIHNNIRRAFARAFARDYPTLRMLHVRGKLCDVFFKRAKRDRAWLAAVVAAERLDGPAGVMVLLEETLWGATR